MTASGDPVLDIADVRVAFREPGGWVEAVRGCSLAVEEGEIMGLVGESGCGKSVTALACLGLTPGAAKVSGRLRVCGTDVINARESSLRSVRGGKAAMIFQNPMAAMNPFISIGRQLSDAITCHRPLSRRQATGAAVEALASVHLPDPELVLVKYPHELSGGQLQRVMIAMALSCAPRLLIADEPTTALDVTVQAQVLMLIRELAREHGLTILFITHDLGVVATICDKVSVMYAGQVVEQAGVHDLFERPRHPYTSKLLRTVPRIGGGADALSSIPGTVPDPRSPIPGCAFAGRCDASTETCRQTMPRPSNDDGRHMVRCHHALAGRPDPEPAERLS
ncbi:MAG: ABC transporter ATP-binding protein [Proteobacteria bacterium]|nr:MAG: ABC transporter ATP-binding protein [Pseudomonadota bacterium]